VFYHALILARAEDPSKLPKMCTLASAISTRWSAALNPSAQTEKETKPAEEKKNDRQTKENSKRNKKNT